MLYKSRNRQVVTKKKHTVMILSVLDPKKGGFGVHTANLCLELQKYFDIIIITQDDPRHLQWCKELRVDIVDFSHYSKFLKDTNCPIIYNLANNEHHYFCWKALKRKSGIIVMHEYNIAGLYQDDTEEAILYEFDRDPLYLTAYSKIRNRNPLLVGLSYLLHSVPITKIALDRSSSIIVHSDFLKHKMVTNKRVSSIPLYPNFHPEVLKESENLCKDKLRKQMGYSRDDLILCSFGFASQHKRIYLIVESLKKLKAAKVNFKCVFVGKCTDIYFLNYIRDCGLSTEIKLLNRVVSNMEFMQYMKISDVVLNLRYPTVEESSGPLVQAMSLGCCVVVNDYATFSDLPNDAVYKLSLINNTPDDQYLFEAIYKLANDSKKRESIGRKAKEYMSAFTREKYGKMYKAHIDHEIRTMNSSI